MGAYKNLCIEVAEAGKCLVGPETLSYLDDLECRLGIDWIGYTEYDFAGHDGKVHVFEGIRLGDARRLVAEELANDEIKDFVEHFGWLTPSV